MRKKYSAFVRLLVVLSMVLALVGLVATPAGALVTAAPSLINIEKDFYKTGTSMKITADGGGVNTSPFTKEWVSITVRSTSGADSESFYLEETGADTDKFEKTIDLVTGTAAADGKLQVTTIDSIAVYLNNTGDLGTGTLLNGATNIGATTITVDSGSGFANGEWIRIGASGAATTEYRAIVSGGGTTTFTVAALANAHADNAEVVEVRSDTAGTDDIKPASKIFEDLNRAYDNLPGYLNAAAIPGNIYTFYVSGLDTGIGVQKLTLSVSGAAGIVVYFDGTSTWETTESGVGSNIFIWNIPADGKYTLVSQATDALGNVEVAPADLTTETSQVNIEIVTVDSVKPAAPSARAERDDRDSAPANLALDKVASGRDVTLWATATDELSGVDVVWFDLNANTTRDTSTEDTTRYGTTNDYYLEVANVGSVLGTKTFNVYAIDKAGNQSTAGTVSYEVISDATGPTISSPSVVYTKGVEALRTETVTISARILDDASGVSQAGDKVQIKDDSPLTGTSGHTDLVQTNTLLNDASATAGDTTLTVDSTTGMSAGDWLRVETERIKIKTVDSTTVVTLDTPLRANHADDVKVVDTSTLFKVSLTVGSTLAYGTKTLTILATDNAGKTTEATVNVVVAAERTHWTVALASGWNFISLPRTPVDSSLAAALAGTPITEIHTAAGGVWSGAKLVGGVWTGTLTRIEAGKGYVALASAAGTLTETFTAPQPLETPPSVDLPAGWSLIGFASLALEMAIDADAYLSSVAGNWSIIYSPGEGWTSDRPAVDGTLTDVKASKAYWVFMTKAATLAP